APKKSGKGAVQVDIAAVHEKLLACGVAGLFGEQKDYGMGDFFGGGHAVAEGDFAFDARAGGGGIGKFREPGLIERRHDLGGEDGVDADLVREEFDGPFACEAEDGGFGGDVPGGVALPGYRCFGADIDDGTVELLESGQGVVSEVVNVEEVALERAE